MIMKESQSSEVKAKSTQFYVDINDNKSKDIVIISHNLSNNIYSEFFALLRDRLKDNKINNAAFNHAFIVSNTIPSADHKTEITALINFINKIKVETKMERFHLFGRSFGGVLSAAVAAISPDVSSLSIVSLPYKFGYPLNLSGSENYIREFQQLLHKIVIPICVIQGTNDDLGSLQDINHLLSGLHNASSFELKGFSHGLESPGHNIIDNYNQVISILILVIRKLLIN